MPLIDIKSNKPITRIPFAQEFAVFGKRLSPAEFDASVARINELIAEAGGEIATAGWLPGADWTGTPFEPIYEKGARKDRTCSP